MEETALKLRKSVRVASPSESSSNDIKSQEEEQFNKETSTTTTRNNGPLSLENICWFLASVLATYYSNILNVLLFDKRINRSLLNVALFLLSVNIMIALYMIAWLSHVKKVRPEQWSSAAHPTLIPLATACFITGSIVLTIALWPVYTWLTMPLLFTIFMGLIVLIINLPSWI